MQVLIELARASAQSLGYVLPYLAIGAVAFTALTYFSPCNAGRPWWNKRGLVTDLTYWIFIPVLTRFARIGFTVLFTVYLLGITGADQIAAFYVHGHGPLARMPLWLQIAFYLLVSDLVLYWIHRGFHRGVLWIWNGLRRRASIPSTSSSAPRWSIF